MGFGEPPDIIMEFDPETGTSSEIYHQDNDFQSLISSSGAHTNAIDVLGHMDAISFSMLNINTIAVVSYPDGNLIHTFGGSQSDFSGMSWNAQHNHHVTEDSLVVFNNRGSAGGSNVLKFDINGNSAELVLEYASGTSSQTFGDAKVLPNGNIIVAYSNAGVIHEISSNGELIQLIDTGPIGYIVRRTTLYGPPPPWGTPNSHSPSVVQSGSESIGKQTTVSAKQGVTNNIQAKRKSCFCIM